MTPFDCEEALRWLRQARHTLASIRVDLDAGFYDWACFKSHQAAESCFRALLRGAGVESFGHNLLEFWRRTSRLCRELEPLYECIAMLNKLYIPPRYPDAWAAGVAPYESFTRRDAVEALECAERVVRAVEVCIRGACPGAEEQA